MWTFVAVLLGAGGVVGSALTAVSFADNDAATSRAAFAGTSAEVASTLELALAGDESLLISARAFLHGNPDATSAQFTQWTDDVRAYARYPELRSASELVIVRPAELPAFAARVAVALRPGSEPSEGPFQLVPPGDRPFYCLAGMNNIAPGVSQPPAGFDYCGDPFGRALMEASRNSGEGSYEPTPPVDGVAWLVQQIPIYRDGTVPATVEARQAAILGGFAIIVDPQVVLSRALQGNPGMSVSMRYQLGSSDVEFASGGGVELAADATIDLHNGWTVRTFGRVETGGMFTNGSALLLLSIGVALSLVVAVLVLVLGTGRARALQMVAEQTGELRHQALHDALTTLPNRALIVDRIEQLLARNRRHGTTGSALFVDIDDFKNVNDTLGHAAGDRLLVAVAARLTSALRGVDTIGRMGGDEFVVLIDGAQVDAAPELVAGRLIDVMRQPFQLDGTAMPISVNISIGIATGDRAGGGELLRDADVALYEAKGAGKNRYEIYQPEMQTEISRRVDLEFELRAAIANHQFHLAYQPIYNLDDLTLVGVEALLRWEHPTLGNIEPDEFIPILEQSGQIQQVGRWVLGEACRQMAAWHALGDTLDVSVNVSGRQLDHDDIVGQIGDALQVSGLPPTSLIIEVTETALMRNAANTARRLRDIRALGVRIAVDDFGTGYSSLAYLQQFPVDCLKIDRSFTNAITTSPESKALIGTLVQLGRDLGLKTLAEGVESTGQMDHLRGEHVNEAQGFLLSRPLDAQTLETQILAPARPDAKLAQPI